MNIVKFQVRTLNSGSESNQESKLGASLPLVPSIGEHAAPLKNKFLVGVEGRLPLRDCVEKEFTWGPSKSPHNAGGQPGQVAGLRW